MRLRLLRFPSPLLYMYGCASSPLQLLYPYFVLDSSILIHDAVPCESRVMTHRTADLNYSRSAHQAPHSVWDLMIE